MMCLLPRLKQEEFDSKEQSLIRECTLVKPLLLHFGKYCAPNGCFGRTIACLMFHKNWKIQYTDASEETPECLTHDIVTLQSNIKQFKVTLVNNIKYFTVYVHAEHSASMSRLRRVIVYAMKEVLKKKMKVLQGFKCSICNSTPVHILPLPSMDASLIICEYKPDTKIPLEKSFKVWGQKAEGGELGISQTVTTANTEPLDIDKDGCRVKNLLKDVNKEELKRLFEELGLSNATLTNRYSDSAVAYLDDLVRAWIALGKDAVLDKGGATWESLKKALQRLGQHGIVVNITPSTADSSPITKRSMREDISHGSSQSPDESRNVRLRIKEQPSSSHNQNDEGVVQTDTHHNSLQQQKELRWFLVMIIMLFMLLVGMIGYYVFFRES